MTNCRKKFDVASFIIGGEIRNRTNNKNTQTVTNISTPGLSACVDNKWSKNSDKRPHHTSCHYWDL